MAIKDLELQDTGLPREGVIRLGTSQPGSKGGKQPSEAPHFVLHDAPLVKAAYPANPTELKVYLPFPTPAENLHDTHALYRNGWCACRGDGDIILSMYDAKGMTKLVRNGVVKNEFSEDGQTFPVGSTVPCPGLDHDLWDRCADCNLETVLYVLVRDPNNPKQLVKGGNLAYYQIRTHSINNWRSLLGELNYAYKNAPVNPATGEKTLQGIPFILRRVQRATSYPDMKAGERRKGEKWFVDLYPEPQYVSVTTERAQRLAMDPTLALPPAIDQATGEVVIASQWGNTPATPAVTSAASTQPQEGEIIDDGPFAGRPWTPEMVQDKLGVLIDATDPATHIPLDADGQRKFVTTWKNVFGGLAHEDKKRHELLKYLVGIESVKEMTVAVRDVLVDWMKDITNARFEAEVILALLVEA